MMAVLESPYETYSQLSVSEFTEETDVDFGMEQLTSKFKALELESEEIAKEIKYNSVQEKQKSEKNYYYAWKRKNKVKENKLVNKVDKVNKKLEKAKQKLAHLVNSEKTTKKNLKVKQYWERFFAAIAQRTNERLVNHKVKVKIEKTERLFYLNKKTTAKEEAQIRLERIRKNKEVELILNELQEEMDDELYSRNSFKQEEYMASKKLPLHQNRSIIFLLNLIDIKLRRLITDMETSGTKPQVFLLYKMPGEMIDMVVNLCKSYSFKTLSALPSSNLFSLCILPTESTAIPANDLYPEQFKTFLTIEREFWNVEFNSHTLLDVLKRQHQDYTSFMTEMDPDHRPKEFYTMKYLQGVQLYPARQSDPQLSHGKPIFEELPPIHTQNLGFKMLVRLGYRPQPLGLREERLGKQHTSHNLIYYTHNYGLGYIPNAKDKMQISRRNKNKFCKGKDLQTVTFRKAQLAN